MDATVTDRLVGRLVDGRYQVEELIARGGMATVYRALDTRLDRAVALKVMQQTFADDPEFVRRFSREARAAARLSDPNVVSVFDQGEDHGVVFLAMEYVPGRTLRDVLNARGRLPAAECLPIFEAVLRGLAAAHASGLVHRDVKPENVLIRDDGRVKVADFGLARAADASATNNATRGLLIGTVAYLAPEQVSPGVSDERSDVYAAGILLFELLTGRPPFTGDQPIAVAYQHVNEKVPPPSSVVRDVPPSLDAVVLLATHRDPAERPANAAALLVVVESVPTPSTTSAPIDLQQTVVVPLPGATTARQTAVTPAPAVASAAVQAPKSVKTSDDLPVRRRKWRGLVALVLVIALAAAAAGLAWWLNSGQYTTVPAVAGLVSAQAEAKLSEQGLGVEFANPKFSEIVPDGEVISSDPEAGEQIADDGTVALTLSKGPERYEVPEVVGLSLAKARAKIKAGNLSVGTVKRSYSDTVDKGIVISTAPPDGQKVRPDTAVTLTVSRGLEPVSVPNVVEMTVEEARKALSPFSLTLDVVDERYDGQVPEGAIISQDPASTASVPQGSTVSVIVSQGPPLVTVPDVVDVPVDEAIALLEAANFEVETSEQFGISPLNRVVTQDPEGDTQAPRGSTIHLIIF